MSTALGEGLNHTEGLSRSVFVIFVPAVTSASLLFLSSLQADLLCLCGPCGRIWLPLGIQSLQVIVTGNVWEKRKLCVLGKYPINVPSTYYPQFFSHYVSNSTIKKTFICGKNPSLDILNKMLSTLKVNFGKRKKENPCITHHLVILL